MNQEIAHIRSITHHIVDPYNRMEHNRASLEGWNEVIYGTDVYKLSSRILFEAHPNHVLPLAANSTTDS